MRLALWQTEGHAQDKAANLAALSRMAKAAATAGAELLLVPECWLAGYNVPEEDVARDAEPQGGVSMRRIGEIAAENAIAIAYGYAERDGGKIYNSAAIIGPDGLLGHYRKVHLFSEFEHARYSPGECFAPLFSYRGWKIGLLICYDVEFPEAMRGLAVQGAELILIPTALTPEYVAIPGHIVPARAVENQLFVAYCNHAGVENGLAFLGGSCLSGPDGEKLASAGQGDVLLIADISQDLLEKTRPAYPYLRDRRPGLY